MALVYTFRCSKLLLLQSEDIRRLCLRTPRLNIRQDRDRSDHTSTSLAKRIGTLQHELIHLVAVAYVPCLQLQQSALASHDHTVSLRSRFIELALLVLKIITCI